MDSVRIIASNTVDILMRSQYLAGKSKQTLIPRAAGYFFKGFAILCIALAIYALSVPIRRRPGDRQPHPSAFFGVLGGWILAGPLILRLLHRRTTGRLLKESQATLRDDVVTFTPGGVRRQGSLSESDAMWQGFPQVDEFSAGLLIWQDERVADWVDATWFHSQAEANQVTHWARAGAKKYKVIRPIEIPHFSGPGDDFTQDET